MLLPGYLLSTQGDRMGMAHGIEGRFPFLDHRLFELASVLPLRSRLRGLREKDILRRWADRALPRELPKRTKQPYRAPDIAAFFNDDAPPSYRDALLGAEGLLSVGLFDEAAVSGLVRRCKTGRASGFLENQALVAILSTQLWYQQYFAAPATVVPLPVEGADVVLGTVLQTVQN